MDHPLVRNNVENIDPGTNGKRRAFDMIPRRMKY